MDLTPKRVEVTIPAGEALSGVGNLYLARLHRIDFPAGWTAASVTLQASEDGVEFNDVYLDDAEYVVSSAGAGRSVIIRPDVTYGVEQWRIRSGTSGAPVVQAQARTLQLVTGE